MKIRLSKLSPSAKYALKGMAYLAAHSQENFCLVEDVAQSEKLPRNFLSKIFQQLAHRGLLISRRGPGGGYYLAKPAYQLHLLEIVEAVEEPRKDDKQCLLELHTCGPERRCCIHESVARAEKILADALQTTTLVDILVGG